MTTRISANDSDFETAWSFVADWLNKKRSKEDRWEWVNGPDAVIEYYGTENGVDQWWCAVHQTDNTDNRISVLGDTPNGAIIVLANAIAEMDGVR